MLNVYRLWHARDSFWRDGMANIWSTTYVQETPHFDVALCTAWQFQGPESQITCLVFTSMLYMNSCMMHMYMWSYQQIPRWRHQMETFSVLLTYCEGNPPGTGGFPFTKPVTRSFDVFMDLRLNKLWCIINSKKKMLFTCLNIYVVLSHIQLCYFYGKLFFARTEKTKILYVELLPRYQSWYSKLHVWILGTHKIHHFILKSMILTNTVWIYLIVIGLLNSSPPSAPYMRQWIGSTYVQIMACRLFGWVIANWTIGNKLQLNFYQIQNFSFTKMHLKKIVCEMAANLSRGD